jgi:predicted DCC family thiol-disulfide oxidoreductase YuxK
MKKISSSSKIVFFDGYCNLCNGFIAFLIWIDKNKTLKFSSLQMETAKSLNLSHLAHDREGSLVYWRADTAFTQSQAVIEIFSGLGGFWTIFRVFQIIPVSLRNSIYRFVARNRFRFFGKRSTCRMPTTKELEQFLP